MELNYFEASTRADLIELVEAELKSAEGIIAAIDFLTQLDVPALAPLKKRLAEGRPQLVKAHARLAGMRDDHKKLLAIGH